MGMSMSRRNMTVGSNSDDADRSLWHKACGCVWLHSHLNIVVPSSCIFVNLLVWTHAPFMHSAKHPKVGREGNFCSHPVHPSYTLPNNIRASYGSCFVEYYSTVLSVRCRPSSVNIDLTVHSRPDSQKSGTMLHYCSYS